MADLNNAEACHEECMVDINIMYADFHPYETLLTVESEGYEDHAVHLKKHGWESDENDMMWDLYKLLTVPSPVRLFVTRSSKNNQECLMESTQEMVGAYSGFLGDSIVCAVQMPTEQLEDTPATMAVWNCKSKWNVDEIYFKCTSDGHHQKSPILT